MARNAVAAAVMAQAGTVLLIDRSKIHPSSTNPRTTYDTKALAELAEGMRQRHAAGQDPSPTPVKVRPHPTIKGEYELVYGWRRWLAAGQAGIPYLNAIVQELSDELVLDEQLIENNREDVHPLQEALGFQRQNLPCPPDGGAPDGVTTGYGRPVADIAAKIGKSPEYVYGRLKLCALTELARSAFAEGVISLSHALLVARIPTPGLQNKAMGEITSWRGDEVMPYAVAKEHIRNRYMLALASAPFDPRDAQLMPAAGSCADCPKRTGNQQLLFADVGHADTCTDPDCYKGKADAHWQQLAARAEEAGQRVLDDPDLFNHDGTDVSYQAKDKYIDLEARCEDDQKRRPWAKLLGKVEAADLVVARDRAGHPHSLMPRRAAIERLAAKGVAWANPKKSTTADASTARERDKQQRQRATVRALLAAIVAGAERTKPDLALWRFLVRQFLEGGYTNAFQYVAQRRGWAEKGKRGAVVVTERLEQLTQPQLVGLVVEVQLAERAYFSYSDKITDGVLEAAELYGVDIKAVTSQAKEELATRKGKPVKPTTKPAAKGPKKGKPSKSQRKAKR